MQCEMCGKSIDGAFKARIEGVEMDVCESCSRHGEILKRAEAKKPEPMGKKHATNTKQQSAVKKELVLVIRDDISEIIKGEREKKNLKQEDVAKMLAERESVIHKIESGTFMPSMELARKLEKFFRVRLIEQHEEEHLKPVKGKEEATTIGDLVKIKKR